MTRLELDSYGPQGTSSISSGAPWGWQRTQVFTTDDGTFRLSRPYSSNPDYAQSLAVSFRSFTAYSQGGRWIDLVFSTDRLGVPLEVGEYKDAQRFPFNEWGHPGLSLGDTGHGFNTLEGWFEVHDIQRNAAGTVTAFAASFGISNYPAPIGQTLIGGRVWFNSDVAIAAVPEPDAWLLLFAGATAVLVASSLRARRAGTMSTSPCR